jgi:hypothetical protein
MIYASPAPGSPCARLLRLDARYRTPYGPSAVANLKRIEAIGVERFAGGEIEMELPGCVMPIFARTNRSAVVMSL